MQVMARRNAHVAAGGHGDLGGQNLRGHAPRAHRGGRAARHGLDVGCHGHDPVDEAGLGIAIRVRGEQALDIREQHQAVGGGHLCHPGSQTVIVPITDLGRGYGVILIDDR